MLLVNKSCDRNVCRALDYLLKTGGGFKYHKAKSQEKVFLAAASQIVAELDPTLANEDYHSIIPLESRPLGLQKHLTKILEIQRKAVDGDTSHPLRGAFVLPEAARDIPDELKQNMNTNEGWMRFKRLLLNPDLFKEGNALSSDRKASWLNDVELIGFQMGVLPNFRGDYIDTLWAKDNQWMEVQHNYVQWWFPNEVVGMGDGILTPRFLESTANILQSDFLVCSYVQQIMRVSFARKAHFWGQSVRYEKTPLALEGLPGAEVDEKGDNKWENNWIKSTHNYLRMTRFLIGLRFFGLAKEREALFNYLTNVKKENKEALSEKYKEAFSRSYNIWLKEYSKK